MHLVEFVRRQVYQSTGVAADLGDQQVAEVFEQITVELFHVVATVVDFIQLLENQRQVPLQNGGGKIVQDFAVDDAKNVQHFPGVHPVAGFGAGDHLVQKAQGVPHAAPGFARNEPQAFGGHRNFLPVAKQLQVAGNRRQVDSSEIMTLAAGQNRDGNLMGFSRREKKHHMRRRLFQGFQQGVESRDAEHVDLIDDVDLVRTVRRHVLKIFAQFPNLVDAVVGCTVDFIDVRGRSRRDFAAGAAGVAGNRRGALLAVHGLGQNPRHRGFARSPRPRKQDCMGDPAGTDRIGQGTGDMFLLDDFIEGLRSVFSRKDKIGH